MEIEKDKNIRGIYDKRYSNFKFMPGYFHESDRTLRFYSLFKKAGFCANSSNKSYIDLGCGFGFKTYVLASFFNKSVGVDFSENPIKVATLLNDCDKLEFKVGDVLEFPLVDKFDFVTAFGLSFFNISDVEELAQNINAVLEKYLSPNGELMIYSFTDYSGKAPSGWHLHTPKELSMLMKGLESSPHALTAKIVFPHKLWSNYFGFGMKNFAVQLYKLLFDSKKDYFILLRKNG